MKNIDKTALQLLDNRGIFEEIHQLKAAFVALFSDLANEFPPIDLRAVHPSSKGTKVSKGNELQNCPYQVLDIIRDFDKDEGFNIRLLNWWGRGMFVFIFFGEHNKNIHAELLRNMKVLEYCWAKTSSPWDYKNMIDNGYLERIDHRRADLHLRQFHYLQLVKKIHYPDDFPSLKSLLKEQVEHILNFYGR